MKLVLVFLSIATIGTLSALYLKGKIQKKQELLHNQINNEESQIISQDTQSQNQEENQNQQEVVSYDLNSLPSNTSDNAEPKSTNNIHNTDNSAIKEVKSNENHATEINPTEKTKSQETQAQTKDLKPDIQEEKVNLANVKAVLSQLNQYDVVKLLRVSSAKNENNNIKRILKSDFFVVLSPNNIIKSNEYQTIFVAPVVSTQNYEKSSQKQSFINIKLKTGENVYIAPSSMRSIPKLALKNKYSAVDESSILEIKKNITEVL